MAAKGRTAPRKGLGEAKCGSGAATVKLGDYPNRHP
jgi:hypothetical protein